MILVHADLARLRYYSDRGGVSETQRIMSTVQSLLCCKELEQLVGTARIIGSFFIPHVEMQKDSRMFDIGLGRGSQSCRQDDP